jgi:hypothetical protein
MVQMLMCCWDGVGLQWQTRNRSALDTRGDEENKQKKGRTYLPTFFLRFFEIFRSDFRKYFVVFLGSSCRETAKNAIKKSMGKDDREKKTLNFFGFPPKQKVFVVFLSSPC